MKSYNAKIKQLQDPTASADRKRFEDTLALFKKYGDAVPLRSADARRAGLPGIAARPERARATSGAIGIMQVMPATGAELKVGDIRIAESNVHAGTKYMDQLMTRYFGDAQFDESNRTLFAFAAYNCGPGNIDRMREEAAQARPRPTTGGSTTSSWSRPRRSAPQTTTYVRNIYKYYVAYKLMTDVSELQRKAREGVQPGK